MADFFMAAFVYILFSETTGKTYTGSTENLLKRLQEHNAGKTGSNRNGIPWKIWYVIEYCDIKEARNMEKYFKTGAGRRKLKTLLEKIPKP